MEFIAANWSAILTFIFTAISAWVMIKQLNKEKAEVQKLEKESEKISGVDTTKTYAELAELTGKKTIELYARIDKLDEKVQGLYDACIIKDNEIEVLRDEVQEKNNRIGELELVVSKQEERILELEREIIVLRNKQ